LQDTLQMYQPMCTLQAQPFDFHTFGNRRATVRKQGRPGSSRRGDLTTIAITCITDGHAHDVPDVQIAGPQADRRGRYVAVCGHVVTAAPMVEPEGAPCPLCAAF
jgi:hypothetical protein